MDILGITLWAVTAYIIVGFIFSVFFVVKGIGTIDPAAKGTTLGFRLIIVPGLVAFWPLIARRWMKGLSEPPEEINAHRVMAKKDHA